MNILDPIFYRTLFYDFRLVISPRVQRPSQLKMITFWRRRRTLEGSLGRTGMGTQTMVERPLVFFIKESIIDKIFAIRLEGLFWARNKVGCSFKFELWAWPLEASHYTPVKGSTYYTLLAIFQPIYLDSQQSLATQSHGRSTWTAIVWSGPKSCYVHLLLNLSYIISPPPIITSTIGFSIIGQQVQNVVQSTSKNKELCNPFFDPYLNPQLEVRSR
jgi:hypothetical protein